VTGDAVAAVLLAAIFIGWAASLVRAVIDLRADVRELQRQVELMVVAEREYARLWLPVPPEGGSGGGKASE
jgi:TM2 domain-containing membrane protein YozV